MRQSTAFITALFVLVLACSAQLSRAALTLTLGLGNPGISGYVGPYGTIDVTRTGNDTASIVLTALDSNNDAGPYHFLFGDGGTIYLNVNEVSAGATTYSGLSAAGPGGPEGGPFSDGGAGTQDGWGKFNFSINNTDGFSHAVSTLSFNITSTGANWATNSDVLMPNSKGYLAGGHVFVANADGSNTNNTWILCRWWCDSRGSQLDRLVAAGYDWCLVPPPPDLSWRKMAISQIRGSPWERSIVA